MSLSAMENQKELLKAVDEISIDGKKGSAPVKQQTEARKARKRVAPEDIPDAPPSVVAGDNPDPREPEELEEDPQRGGLSGPGSFEAAMALFGPKTINVPNPHGTHEVTEEG